MVMVNTKKRKKRRASVPLLFILVVFMCGLIWICYSTMSIEITRYEVEIPNLPKNLDGYTIAQASDLHRGRMVFDNVIERTVNAINSVHPDAAVITGDFISTVPGNADPCCRMLSKIKARNGIYGVMGNHDYKIGAYWLEKAAKKYGIKMLVNQSDRAADGLWFAGIDDFSDGKPDPKKTFKGIPKNAAYVMLAHEPTTICILRDKQGLLLTGHTHGGQIRIPMITANMMLSQYTYYKGWYKEGQISMYVNRGIGMTGGVPIRFRCRPEVSVFVLRSPKH